MRFAVKMIYCDTNTLFHNIQGHDSNTQKELDALQKLLVWRQDGSISMFRSHINLREITATPDLEQREKLIADYETLDTIPNDEKLLGFHTITDPYGGFATTPLISDVQDERICGNIYCVLEQRLGRGNDHKRRQMRRDAEHITQAITNKCDVFLTRDYETIIKPLREYLEIRFSGFKVRLPSELVSEIESRTESGE
jgi:hypothetical protein